jgi:soluble lytic murein transglycosylase
MKSRARLALVIVGVLLLTFLAEQWRRAHLEASQDGNILAASRKHHVDPALIKAVIWRESRFNPDERGSKGEVGLMQIMEGTGTEWAGAQRVPLFSKYLLVDAAQNVDCGTWYLRKLLGRYPQTDNPVPYALADYNAGRGNVLKWMGGSAATNSAAFIGQVRFPSTRDYVRSVMQRREKYVSEFAPKR